MERYPTALDIATYAVAMLEDHPLFNAGKGAVFTRDGTNELEASVMVSRPSAYAKRGVGVTGLRRVRNPIKLARAVLEHGDEDLRARRRHQCAGVNAENEKEGEEHEDLDVPSAQGHTLIHGTTAEILAGKYGLDLVDPSYFFTQKRWDEHNRSLERASSNKTTTATATWSPDEFLPQGTVGAVAMDADGMLCVATSTGGVTNKLTGRIGDTPVVGAGFWAEEWEDEAEGPKMQDLGVPAWQSARSYLSGIPGAGPTIELGSALRRFLADCLPTPSLYAPIPLEHRHGMRPANARKTITTRAMAISGTGNGDSFMRIAAARTAGAIARWGRVSAAEALSRVAGPGGELQRSAGDRWGHTGEGEGGMIGIEVVGERSTDIGHAAAVGGARAVVMHDHNSSGMFRAWIDDGGVARFKIWRDYDD